MVVAELLRTQLREKVKSAVLVASPLHFEGRMSVHIQGHWAGLSTFTV